MDKRGFRTNLFKVLFQFEFCEPEQMQDKLSLFLQEEGIVREQDYKNLEKKLTDIINHLPELDAKIEAYSNGWKKERIGKAELAILRLAIYEVLFDDIPDAVAINEAVELAKLYTDEKAHEPFRTKSFFSVKGNAFYSQYDKVGIYPEPYFHSRRAFQCKLSSGIRTYLFYFEG